MMPRSLLPVNLNMPSCAIVTTAVVILATGIAFLPTDATVLLDSSHAPIVAARAIADALADAIEASDGDAKIAE